MSWRRFGIVAVLLAFTLEGHAYVRPRWQAGPDVVTPRWPDGGAIPFVVNTDPPNSILPGSQPYEAVRNAFEIRSTHSDIRFSLAPASDPDSIGRDGTNLVTFVDTVQNRSVVGSFGAVVNFWWEFVDGEPTIVEADIVFNPDATGGFTLSTDGTGQNDIEGLTSHEITHVLMLEHAGALAVTGYPDNSPVQLARSLEMDDVAGSEFLYPFGDTSTRTGAMSGTVMEDGTNPVFGANVVAVRQSDGDVTGDVSVFGGEWRIDAMPPGDYVVYAEPYDGPQFQSQFSGGIYDPDNNTFDTVFRTTYAGGNASPTVYAVTAGAEISGIAIEPPSTAPGLNARFLGISPNATTLVFDSFAVEMTQGTSVFLTVMGPGIDTVPDDGLSVTGPGVAVSSSGVNRGTFFGTPYMIVSVTVAADAPPVPRTLLADNGTVISAVSGGIEVLASSPAPSLLRSDVVTSIDPVTPALSGIFPLDATGPDAFPGTGEGTLRELPGTDDDDDLYVPEVPSGFLDPDEGVAADLSRPLVFYRLTDPSAELHLNRTSSGRIEIVY